MKTPSKMQTASENFFRITLMLTVLLLAVALLMPEDKDGITSAQVAEFSTRIEPIAMEDLVAKIRASRGTPLMMMVYASWCGTCRSVMPQVLETFHGDRAQKGFNVLMVSVDNRMEKLARYLLKSGYDKDFTPYIIKPTSMRTLGDSLKPLGNHYRSEIPYIAIYNAQGKLHREFTGSFPKDALHQALLEAF